MVKASDNAYPSILITEGTEPSAPAAGKQRLYIDSTSHKLMRTNSSGTETTIESGAGFSYTWTSATSMPGGPATNDRVTRTDLGMDFYYDGTRWLSTQIFRIELKVEATLTWPLTANTLPVHRGVIPFGDEYDYYLLKFYTLSTVLTTNTGSAYWTVQVNKYNSALGGDATVAQFDTSGDSPDTGVNKEVTINALLGSFEGFYTRADKTSTPGNFRIHAGHMTCRVVGT